MLWIVRHIPPLKMCLLTTKLSWQRYVWAYTGMRCKRPILHTDWFLLNNRVISDEYMITLKNKLDALQEISETLTLNDEYENFVNVHMEAATECITTKLRTKHRVPWETTLIKMCYYVLFLCCYNNIHSKISSLLLWFQTVNMYLHS